MEDKQEQEHEQGREWEEEANAGVKAICAGGAVTERCVQAAKDTVLQTTKLQFSRKNSQREPNARRPFSERKKKAGDAGSPSPVAVSLLVAVPVAVGVGVPVPAGGGGCLGPGVAAEWGKRGQAWGLMAR